MLLCRMVVVLLFFLFSGVQAYAQNFTLGGQWVDDLYLVESFTGTGNRTFNDRVAVLVDEKDNIHKFIPTLLKVKNFSISDSNNQGNNSIIWFPFPVNAVATWHNDTFYAIACATGQLSQSPTGEQVQSYYTREDGSKLHRWFFAKQKDGEDNGWQYLGFYDTEPRTSLKAIPCDDDIFIVIASPDFSANRSNISPFFRVSVPNNDKKELRLDSYIDCGQDEVRNYMSDHDVFELASYSDIIMTDKFATLVNRTSGLYWIFSKEKASLMKSGSIFRNLKANHLAYDGFERAVLYANPEKDGTVLISAQDEDFLLKMVSNDAAISKEFNELSRSGFFKSVDEAHEWFARRRKEEETIKVPYIVWYRIYPDTGKFEKLLFPPEGGSLFRDDDDNNRIWRPMPDGSVKMGYGESAFALGDVVEQKMKNAEKDNPAEETKKEPDQPVTAQPKGDNPPSKNDK